MNKKLILFSLILVSSLVSCGTVISSGGPLQQGGITDQEKNPTKHDSHDTNPRASKLLTANVIVKFEEDKWMVQSEGAKKASNHFDTKEKAIEKGKEIAQNKNTSLIIYKKDGTKEREINY